MYCPTCGTRFDQTLSYCKTCGANLAALKGRGEVEKSAPSMDTLVWGIVVSTITLLGMGLGALVLIRDGAIDAGLGRVFVILSFVALLAVEGVLIWRLMSVNKADKGPQSLPQPHDLGTDKLESSPARALHEAASPMPSVTEQTTRTFEPLSRGDEPH